MLLSQSWMASFLHSFFAFIIILVPLVVFHEFGHYVFARIFNVKAEIFSVGFGPTLWKKQMGETEFRISAIPLGGYVKLLGEDRDSQLSAKDQKRALHRQAAWKRFFIFLGGPLFNFILAIFIFMAILLVGEPQVASVAGRVVHGSAAYQAGFQSGDQITAIDGKPIRKYEDLIIALNENPGKKLDFSVVHPQTKDPVTISVTPSSQVGFSIYGESKPVGEIQGLFPAGRSNQAGVSDPLSPAAQAGIQTGDKIIELNQQPIENWERLEAVYMQIPAGTQFRLKVQKTKGTEANETKEITFRKPQGQSEIGQGLGLHSSELFIEKVVAESPAEKAGIKNGDRLVGVGNLNIQSFFELREAVQKSGEKDGKVQVRWEREGRMMTSIIVPTATNGRDPILNKTVQYTIGVMPMLSLAEPVTVIERILNPLTLMYKATERMVVFTYRNFVSLRKMVTGDVSVGTLGGPIMIGKIAGESLTRGLVAFLSNMAIFSIGLGVLNILPVPVLDGGHLLLLGIESIRRKPLTIRQMEIIQGFGLILILALMSIAFRNDLARLLYS